MRNTRGAALAAISLALGTVLGCPSFTSNDAPAAPAGGDAGGGGEAGGGGDGDGGGDGGGGGIGLRGKEQFLPQAADAVVLHAPNATQPDDMIWVAVGVEGDFPTPTVKPPAGFLARGVRGIQGPPGCSAYFAYYTLRAAVAGPAEYQFPVSAAAGGSVSALTGLLVSYFGVDPTAPIDDEKEGSAGSEAPDSGVGPYGFTTTTLTTTTANAQLLFFLGLGGAGSWVDPTTGPQRVTDTNVLAVFAQAQPLAGKTAAQRFLNNGPKCGEFAAGDVNIVALRPAK